MLPFVSRNNTQWPEAVNVFSLITLIWTTTERVKQTHVDLRRKIREKLGGKHKEFQLVWANRCFLACTAQLIHPLRPNRSLYALFWHFFSPRSFFCLSAVLLPRIWESLLPFAVFPFEVLFPAGAGVFLLPRFCS